MKISYNWLKWYIPECPEPEKLADIFTYHVAEVESLEKIKMGQEEDSVFDIKILPNRAHDLLCHQGIAREVASLLDITFNDPTPKYKVPNSKLTELKIEIKTGKCLRYMGRVVRNIKVGPSPDWVVQHLASMGQRSINNIVDGANIVMFDCGQPIHCFDMNKVVGKIIIRQAVEGEEMTTLDNKQLKLKASDMVIADEKNVLALAGIKGGKIAEVDQNTKNIIIEVANFDGTAVRKSGQSLNIFTDARKRFENGLGAELCSFAMLEMSGLIAEYGFTSFEEVVDVYKEKQPERKLKFSLNKISRILGLDVSKSEIENILKRYNFKYTNSGDIFEIRIPVMRLDLEIEEDMAEEIGRVLGYDKLSAKVRKIDFTPKPNPEYEKIQKARQYLLGEGYSEVMTYVFRDKGEVEVEMSASDKKFLRTNLEDGLLESLAYNSSILPILGISGFKNLKIFEIGTVFLKGKEEIHVAYNNNEAIIEKNLEEFTSQVENNSAALPASGLRHGQNFSQPVAFKMWPLFPFIARDVAVWVPEEVESSEVLKLIKEDAGELVIRGPELFDEFKKDGKVSYAFRLVFQSHDRTLTDEEVNKIMDKITEKIKENKDWQVR